MPRASHSATIASRAWLEHLVAHLELARERADGESVHQVRVAAGRLDVWLRMAGLRVLRDDLRALRRAASEQRDLDVLLQRDLPAEFREWALTEHARTRAALGAEFDAPRTTALLAALSALPPLPRVAASEYEVRAAARVERRGRAALCPDAAVEDLHALRCAVRRLRFAREWLGRSTKRLKALQDELGALNDVAAALALLARCPRQDELHDYREQLACEVRERAARAQAALRNAKLARQE